MMKYELSGQQAKAAKKVEKWWRRGGNQVFCMFGYAGTGKTTLARYLADLLGVQAIYAAYTGKAVHVLRAKGALDARTVHSLIYIPAASLKAEQIADLVEELSQTDDPLARKALQEEIRTLKRDREDMHWVLNERSELRDADLLVLDESSMISTDMAEDLISFDVPMLVLGDPAQLPPVRGQGYFMNRKPDVLLTEVHRQAAESPVLSIATHIRQGRHVPAQRIGESSTYVQISQDEWEGADQVICGRNVTRWRLIRAMRARDGLTGDKPMLGDKIIILANNKDLGVFNGQQFMVERAKKISDSVSVLQLRTELGELRELPVHLDGFRGLREEDEFKSKARERSWAAFATFAQAVTCHKSQGSQWNRVVVVDESRVFRGDDATKWKYTAVTRAADAVHVLRPNQVM